MQGSFSFRVKLGEYEVEVNGSREEVLKTIRELPSLMVDVYKAFEDLKPKTGTMLTVKATSAKEEGPVQKYPKVPFTEKCSEAILRILETDWGKWRPRTLVELKEALEVNDLRFQGRILAGDLMGLVRKGKVRRWKTDAGYVYILAEREILS